MKKILITIAAVIITATLILFIPIPKSTYDDGGTREYEALTYKIIRWNRLTADGVYTKMRIYWGDDRHLSLDELFSREVPYMPTVDDPPITHAVDFEAQYIRTNGYHEDALYPTVTLIRSTDELIAYYNANKELYNLERRTPPASDSTIGFLDACDRYDDAFFKDRCLILILLEESSGSVRHKLTAVQQTDDGKLTVNITTIIPEVGTDDMAQWHLFVGVDAPIADERNILLSFSSVYDGEYSSVRNDIVYQNTFAEVILPLPEDWNCELLDDGIRFRPQGYTNGHLRLWYTDAFGVCGTGLRTETIELGSHKAEQGTYDSHTLWDYIVLPKDWYSIGDYVILNEGADTWWDDHGEKAMDILNGISVYEKVTIEDKAIALAKEVCTLDYNEITAVFDTQKAVWEITFSTKGWDGDCQTVTVDGFTGDILDIEYGE